MQFHTTFRNYFLSFHTGTTMFLFLTPFVSPWWELSNGIPVDVWVQILTPNQPISHHDPAIASSISFCYVPHWIYSTIRQHPPGAETTPLIFSWFELSVCVVSALGMWPAEGALSWWAPDWFSSCVVQNFYQKNPSLVLILWVCRMLLIPTQKKYCWREFQNFVRDDSLQ